ncbi:MAG: flagellar motor protein MotB [Rhodocyclaceae bacterium]|nr:flagellar motor protein MotB [Rhodocyclaceae bacterium]
MSDDTQQPIVVKRIKKGGGAAHGGAWKIAYADFVTAMMAFFLLMWLLGSTSKGDLKGIADHFQTPLLVAMFGGSGAGDASSIIQGGGQDLSQAHGQVKRGETKTDRKLSEKRMKEEFERKERERLQNLKEEIEKLIEATPTLKQFKNQLLLDITSEGLRIQIIDERNRPMFDLASSELKPYTKVILREFGPLLNQVENRITLSGHTDATPFAGGDRGFGNWELSTNRANASRRELVTGGLDDAKVMRVVGFASTVLYDKEQPQSASNRRISIVVMNKRTEEAILSDGKEEPVAEVGDAAELAERGIVPPPGAAAGR